MPLLHRAETKPMIEMRIQPWKERTCFRCCFFVDGKQLMDKELDSPVFRCFDTKEEFWEIMNELDEISWKES
jgi:hypothetical protein